MKSKFFYSLFSVLVALQLAACGALQIAPLDVYKTIDGMKAAVVGSPGTWAFTKSGTDMVVLGWPAGDGRYAFMLLDKLGQFSPLAKACNGNACNWQTAADFVQWLETNGWSSVPAGSLPAGLISAIKQTAFMTALARSGPTSFLLIPMGLLGPNPLNLINPEVNT